MPEEALALGVLGWAEAVTGDVDQGIETFRRGMAIAERLGGVEGIALGHANLAAMLDRVGRSEASLEAAREGYAVAQHLGVSRTYGGVLLGHVAKALFDLGRWDEAAAAADEGLELDPVGRAAIWLHVNRARVDTNQGRFDPAEEHLRQARDLDARSAATRRTGRPWWRPRRSWRPGRAGCRPCAAGSRRRSHHWTPTCRSIRRWDGSRGTPCGPRRTQPRRRRHARTARRCARSRRTSARSPTGCCGSAAAWPRRIPGGVAVAGLCRIELERIGGRARSGGGPPYGDRVGRARPAGTGRLRPLSSRGSHPRDERRTGRGRGGPARGARGGGAASAPSRFRREIERLARHARIELAARPPRVERRRRRQRPDRTRARGHPARRGRTVEPADRRHPVHHAQDRERPRLEHPGQARCREPGRGRGRGPPPRTRRRTRRPGRAVPTGRSVAPSGQRRSAPRAIVLGSVALLVGGCGARRHRSSHPAGSARA